MRRPALLLDRRADDVPPFGPGTVVVADLPVAEEVRQRKPGMATPLADPAVRDHVGIRTKPRFALIDRSELGGRLERAVLVRGARPRDILCARDVPAAERALLGIVGHVQEF